MLFRSDGWTYITNNSQYPDPSYYTSATGPKGLKFNFEGQGVESPEFTAVNAVKVTINIGALNANTKTAVSDDAFTVTGYDADGNPVAGATLAGTGVIIGDNVLNLTGTGIVKVKVIMTGYPHNGTAYCNVNFSSVTLEEGTESSVEQATSSSLSVFVNNNGLMYIQGVEDGSEVEIYSILGARILQTTLVNGTVSVGNLSKGIYVLRVGNYNQKFML